MQILPIAKQTTTDIKSSFDKLQPSRSPSTPHILRPPLLFPKLELACSDWHHIHLRVTFYYILRTKSPGSVRPTVALDKHLASPRETFKAA